jgi:hypothetical protein
MNREPEMSQGNGMRATLQRQSRRLSAPELVEHLQMHGLSNTLCPPIGIGRRCPASVRWARMSVEESPE